MPRTSISDTKKNIADGILVADSNTKIPALDGSLISVLNANNITAGTVANARLDTGTAANKIVLLDGSGNLPAVDGSQLTGISTATVSSSDPTISTNPSGGVGTEWLNSTSGEMYICTDATAGANVWTNVGEGTGDILPILQSQGATYGWVSGGNQGSPGSPTGAQNTNQYFPFASESNATDASDMTIARTYPAGCSSSTHGYCSGGQPNNSNIIDKFQFGTTNNSTDVGDLATGLHAAGGGESTTHGYVFGGTTSGSTGNNLDTIQKFSFASDGNATDTTADLTQVSAYVDGSSSATHGYRHGGQNIPSAVVNTIDKFPFASSANATDVGDLTAARLPYKSTCNSTTHGYTMGGWASPYQGSVIDKFSYATDGNATDVGDLSPTNHGAAGVSGTNHGYSCGGRNQPENTYYNQIQRFSFSSDGNATDSADLVNYPYVATGNQV